MKPAPVSYIGRISALPAEAIRYRSAQNNSGSGGLLLNSACQSFERGLANSSDCVERHLMAQAGNVVLGLL